MYKRILIATDGSAVAECTARHAVALAGAIAAAVEVTAADAFELPEGVVPSPTLSVQHPIDATISDAHTHLGGWRSVQPRGRSPATRSTWAILWRLTR